MTADSTSADLFPQDREALRADLLERVAGLADIVAAHRDATETGRTVAPPVVDALRASGLFRMKAPREVGGAEAHPVTQMDVIEAMALVDPATSWSMFISSAVSGSALSRLPDEGVSEVLANGWPSFVGTLKPDGRAERVDGGWKVSGRWSWGSGLPHADYVSVLVLTGDTEQPVIAAVVPIADVTRHDNWFPLGMAGTGSADYELVEVFVPDHRVAQVVRTNPRRGGTLFRLGMPGYVVNEHGCFAYALAQSAIDLMTATAIEKKRGYAAARSIADREILQREISRSAQRVNASRALMREVVERLYLEAEQQGQVSPVTQAEARAAAVWCTDEALDVVTILFRYAGGGAVMAGSRLQALLRDLLTVQSHLVVSDVAYEEHGRLLLGLDPV